MGITLWTPYKIKAYLGFLSSVKNRVNQHDFVLFLSSAVKVGTEDVGAVPNKVEYEKGILVHESWSHKQESNFCCVL